MSTGALRRSTLRLRTRLGSTPSIDTTRDRLQVPTLPCGAAVPRQRSLPSRCPTSHFARARAGGHVPTLSLEEVMRRFTCALAIVCVWMLAPLAAQEKAQERKAAATAAAPVNLNTATVAQIATLPG